MRLLFEFIIPSRRNGRGLMSTAGTNRTRAGAGHRAPPQPRGRRDLWRGGSEQAGVALAPGRTTPARSDAFRRAVNRAAPTRSVRERYPLASISKWETAPLAANAPADRQPGRLR